jgi:glutamate N-acetyltransferase/amino-acid N-acetyltransferase
VIAALGASGAELDPDKLDIALGDVQVVRGGMGASYEQSAAKQAVAGPDVYVNINLNDGGHEATSWGCDLTHGYIDENATYTR